MHAALAELGLADQVLLWNVVPTHPGTPTLEPAADRAEVAAGCRSPSSSPAAGVVVAVGRVAARALPRQRTSGIRPTAELAAFREGLLPFATGGRLVRRFSA